MSEFYLPRVIEAKWQARWEESGLFRAGRASEAPRTFVLGMPPAPTDVLSSRQLIPCLEADVFTRYLRMRGHDVLHPVHWDVLGPLPERFARDEGASPQERTARHLASFKAGLKALGCAHDWTREVDPSQPEQTRWSQWLFLKMRELGRIQRIKRREGRSEWILWLEDTPREMPLGVPAYWGTPIPIVYCAACDPSDEGLAVPWEQLPVLLPEWTQQVQGEGPPLSRVPSFAQCPCPRCGGPARREPEVMDPLIDGLWVWLRCLSPRCDTAPVDPDEARRWLPAAVYVHHDDPRLLRFGYRVMNELGLVPGQEPFTEWLFAPGFALDGAPLALLERYGADALRVFLLSPDRRGPDTEGVREAAQWLERTWRLARANPSTGEGALHEGPLEGKAREIRHAAHQCLKRVGKALEERAYRHGPSAIRECVNALEAVGAPRTPEEKGALAEALRILAAVLTPFAPHLAEEVAEGCGSRDSPLTWSWPEYDPTVLGETRRYKVQVNGKNITWVDVPVRAAEAEVRAAAEADAKVRRLLEGKRVRRCIFVPGKVVSFVVE